MITRVVLKRYVERLTVLFSNKRTLDLKLWMIFKKCFRMLRLDPISKTLFIKKIPIRLKGKSLYFSDKNKKRIRS